MIDQGAILTYDFGRPEQAYTERDAILYALGLGLGADPLDRADLGFMDERSLKVLPTFAVTLCTPGMWIREPRLGVDFDKLVHSAQWAEFPAPLPPQCRVAGGAMVLSLTDRGEGRGAVLVLERTIADADSGALYCRLQQTLLLRGNGGFGGPSAARDAAPAPDGEPNAVALYPTSPRAALIYRLSGDWNPLHFHPAAAEAAGFNRPILQGLASYGIAAVAVSKALDRDPASVAELECRFSGVVLPGETIAFHIWRGPADGASFSGYVGPRKVLDGGKIAWRTL